MHAMPGEFSPSVVRPGAVPSCEKLVPGRLVYGFAYGHTTIAGFVLFLSATALLGLAVGIRTAPSLPPVHRGPPLHACEGTKAW